MMKTLLLLLLLLGSPAQAQTLPPEPAECYVTSGARGYTMGQTPDGTYGAWWCLDTVTADWKMAFVFARTNYVLVHPQVPAGTSDLDTLKAYWVANVTLGCNAADAAITRLCDAAHNAALDTRPLPPFIVRPNGLALTRPTYPVVNGVRSTTSNGTVPILDPYGRATGCNPVERLGNYMRVKSTPGTVALCSAG